MQQAEALTYTQKLLGLQGVTISGHAGWHHQAQVQLMPNIALVLARTSEQDVMRFKTVVENGISIFQ